MAYPRTKACLWTKKSPVVDNTVDGHPLWFDAKTIVLLLHLGIVRIFHLALVTLPIVLTRAIVQGWGLIHVILPLVVSVHYQVEDFQLLGNRGRREEIVPPSRGDKGIGKRPAEGTIWEREL